MFGSDSVPLIATVLYNYQLIINLDVNAVQVRMGESQLATKALRTLSGGEKSFVNLCFIMAVGFAANSPFHCMDEFDVRLSYTQHENPSPYYLYNIFVWYEHIFVTLKSTLISDEESQCLEKQTALLSFRKTHTYLYFMSRHVMKWTSDCALFSFLSLLTVMRSWNDCLRE